MLLLQLLKSEEDASSKPVQKACVQITDCLVEHVLRLETKAAGKIICCFIQLFININIISEEDIPSSHDLPMRWINDKQLPEPAEENLLEVEDVC